jgi:hypothetical protein
MEKFKLPNGLTAEVLHITTWNERKKRWPKQLKCHANSHVVKMNVKGDSVGLVFSGDCLYQYLKKGETKSLFLGSGAEAVKSVLTKRFEPAARFANCLVYSGKAYESNNVARQALETAVLTGVPPTIRMLMATSLEPAKP